MAGLLVYIAVILVGIPFGLLNTIGYRLMWGWFVTPTFGVAVPSYWLMYGLLLCVSMLFAGIYLAVISTSSKDLKDIDPFKMAILNGTNGSMLLWTTVLMGYVVHLFV